MRLPSSATTPSFLSLKSLFSEEEREAQCRTFRGKEGNECKEQSPRKRRVSLTSPLHKRGSHRHKSKRRGGSDKHVALTSQAVTRRPPGKARTQDDFGQKENTTRRCGCYLQSLEAAEGENPSKEKNERKSRELGHKGDRQIFVAAQNRSCLSPQGLARKNPRRPNPWRKKLRGCA